MRIPPAQSVTSDERLLAAVAHGSIILFGMGAIAAIVIWIMQRQKSAFVSFHALQALMYQLLQTIIYLLAALMLVMLMFCGLILVGALSAATARDTRVFALFPFAMVGSMFCAYGLPFLLGIAGAVRVLMGRDFYYPFIGRRMQRCRLQSLPTRQARRRRLQPLPAHPARRRPPRRAHQPAMRRCRHPAPTSESWRHSRISLARLLR